MAARCGRCHIGAMEPLSKSSVDFVMQARGTLPESACASDLSKLNRGLELLFTDLRRASRLFHEPGDNGRAGAIVALGAMARFIVLFEAPLSEHLEVPGLRLQDALVGLYENSVSALLKPTPRRGRSVSSNARAALMGIAVGTVRRLSEAGMSRPDALRKVALQLKKIGVRPERGSSGEMTANTIRNWWNTVAEDVGRTGTAAIVHDSMFTAEENERFARLPPEKARDLAVASLVRFVQVNFPEIAGAEKVG